MPPQQQKQEGATAAPSKIFRYKGSTQVGQRVIRKEDFKTVGVDMPDQTWSADTSWMVDASDWPVAAIELVKQQQGMTLLEDDRAAAQADKVGNQ